MNLIGQFAVDVAQGPKTGGTVAVITANLGILTILDRGLGALAVILSVVLTGFLIRNHYLKMKILQHKVDEIKANKELEK